MSPLILALTAALLILLLAFGVRAALGQMPGWLPVLLMSPVYAWVWLRMRPTRFVVHAQALELVWPLKRAVIARAQISSVRPIDRQGLRDEAGWCMRVGVGGLWGAFGWLCSRRKGIIQMYISRTDGLVWIECGSGRPWLLTPEQPEQFVRTLRA